MKSFSIFISVFVLLSACNKERKYEEIANIKRNELAGVWRIHRVVRESFTVDSGGITLTRFDTTYQGIHSYYTISIPTAENQITNNPLAYGVLEGEIFDCLVNAEARQKDLFSVTLDHVFCQTCKRNSARFAEYMQGTWEVDKYEMRKALVLKRQFTVNGVERNSSIELIYAL